MVVFEVDHLRTEVVDREALRGNKKWHREKRKKKEDSKYGSGSGGETLGGGGGMLA